MDFYSIIFQNLDLNGFIGSWTCVIVTPSTSQCCFEKVTHTGHLIGIGGH